MHIELKGLSKHGNTAVYTGLRTVVRLSLTNFPGGVAPTSIEIVGPVLGPREKKAPRAKLTRAERAALPKPTLAERIARREASLVKLKAKAELQLA